MGSDMVLAAEWRVRNAFMLPHLEKIDVPNGKVLLQCPECGWASESMTQYEALYPPVHHCSKMGSADCRKP